MYQYFDMKALISTIFRTITKTLSRKISTGKSHPLTLPKEGKPLCIIFLERNMWHERAVELSRIEKKSNSGNVLLNNDNFSKSLVHCLVTAILVKPSSAPCDDTQFKTFRGLCLCSVSLMSEDLAFILTRHHKLAV